MVRSLLAAGLVLSVCAFTVFAKEYKGDVTKIDTEKKLVTVKIDGEEKVFAYTDESTFVGGGKGGAKTLDKDGIAKTAEKLGKRARPATIVTEEKDEKEVMKDGKLVISKVTFGGKGKN